MNNSYFRKQLQKEIYKTAKYKISLQKHEYKLERAKKFEIYGEQYF